MSRPSELAAMSAGPIESTRKGQLKVNLNNVLVEPGVSRCGEVDIGEQEVTRKNKPRLSIGEKVRLRELGGHVGDC
jgi:hypothetical protein